MNNDLAVTALHVRQCIVPLIGADKNSIHATGFFIHEDGVIATAAHAIKSTTPHVVFQDEILECEVLKSELRLNFNTADPEKTDHHEWDIAILKIKNKSGPFPYLQLSGQEEFSPGEKVAMYGYFDAGAKFALGTKQQKVAISALLTQGIVSTSFHVQAGNVSLGSRLIVDISGGPGSSGSPLFDTHSGLVIGIVTDGKLKDVLTPGQEKGAVRTIRIPMGITETDPVIHLKAHLEKFYNK